MHESVLLHEVIAALSPRADDALVDATLGGAGHAHALGERLGEKGILIGLDADEVAVERARARLADLECALYLKEQNFRHLGDAIAEATDWAREHLPESNLAQSGLVGGVVMDLGLSSIQLEEGARGFSFLRHERLVMTFAAAKTGEDAPLITAYDVVNDWSEEHLADVLAGFGEERHARRIARAIIERRAEAPIEYADDLADLISCAYPPRARQTSKRHPATKSFQAIRIAVNDELGALADGIRAALARLAPAGTLAIISFHSLEDRLVKRAFRDAQRSGGAQIVTKRPITPTPEEVARNPRARSAKLRIIKKHS